METKIEFDDILIFIDKAIDNNLTIQCYDCELEYSFRIYNSKEDIYIRIFEDKYEITSFSNHIKNGYCIFKYDLNEREKLMINKIYLDVKEYNEKKALNTFNNFFANTEDKPTSVDDLNDDDD